MMRLIKFNTISGEEAQIETFSNIESLKKNEDLSYLVEKEIYTFVQFLRSGDKFYACISDKLYSILRYTDFYIDNQTYEIARY